MPDQTGPHLYLLYGRRAWSLRARIIQTSHTRVKASSAASRTAAEAMR